MIKEFTLTQDEIAKLTFAKRAENAKDKMQEEWERIAKARNFNLKTIKSIGPGKFEADFKDEEPPVEELLLPDMGELPFGNDTSSESRQNTPSDPQEEEPVLKVKALTAHNYKKLDITITPEGKSFTLRGDNAVGKSSVIDAIFTTLSGTKGNSTERPIQTGKDSAENTVELCLETDMTFEGTVIPKGTVITAKRTYSSNSGTRLNVKVDGKVFKNGTDLMKFIMEQCTIADPTELWNMKAVDLKKYLTKISGIEEALDAVENDLKKAYDEKYLIERNIEAFKNEIETEYGTIPDNMIEPDTKEIQEAINIRIKKADEINNQKENVRKAERHKEESNSNVLSARKTIEDNNKEIASIESQIAHLQRQIDKKKEDNITINQNLLRLQDNVSLVQRTLDEEMNKLAVLESEYSLLPDRSAEMENLKEEQRKFVRLESKKKLQNRLRSEMDKQEANIQEVKDLEERRKNIFVSAKMPIPGLSITQEGIMYEGVPLTKDQISEAQGLELCLDILIAQRPKLRLLACKYGHAFSDKTLKRILGKSKYADFQLIIERVSNADKLEIEYIEEEPVE